jgi:arabinofuranosyltransferase
MARLPIELRSGWRQAHHFREPVPGYQESLVRGENRIVDPDRHEYYAKIRVITRDKIWSWKRLRTIVAMNLGRYDYLLASYEARRQAARPMGK